MRVTLTTAGSRGDVQPYLALAKGLAARGHVVTVATHAPFEAFVRAQGLAFRPLAGDPQALITGEVGIAWLESATNVLAFVRGYADLMGPLVDEVLADLHAAVADADAVLFSPLTFPAYDFAEARGIPALMGGFQPLTATRAFPFIILPDWLRGGGTFNWLTHQAVLHAGSLALAGRLNPWRRRLGLDTSLWGGMSLDRQAAMSTLYGYSSAVVPTPDDWGDNVLVTGTWFLDAQEDWQPPEALSAFLEGEPPVYVGFGSMVSRHPEQLAAQVFEGLRLAGRRGIVLAGWAGLDRAEVPDHVLMVHDVPHAWLFPRMSAIVHHGGAGTTAAALRAGVPSIVAPYFADQPFWAARVHALGVGPAPLPQAALTAERLAERILATDDPAMRDRAAALGERIREEDGVAAACDAFARFATTGILKRG